MVRARSGNFSLRAGNWRFPIAEMAAALEIYHALAIYKQGPCR